MTWEALLGRALRALPHQSEQPRLVVAAAPLAAISLGLTQLLASRGPVNDIAAIVAALVLLAYLLLIVGIARDDRFLQPSWVLWITLASLAAAVVFPALTHGGPDMLAWWYAGSVTLALIGYLCRPRDVVVAIAVLALHAVVVVSTTVGLAGHLGLLLLGLCAVVLPGLFTMRILGQARTSELAVREESLRDAATGVLSMRGLEHEIGRLASTATGDLSVLAVRIDGFTEINDAWGFTVAEQVRSRVARALSRALRRDHAVARVASDVFAVVTSAPGDQTAAVVRELARSADEERAVTVSVGGVTQLPVSSIDPNLLRQALEQARSRIPAPPAHDQQDVSPLDLATAAPLPAAATAATTARRRPWRSASVPVGSSRQLGAAMVAVAVLGACTPLTTGAAPGLVGAFQVPLVLLAGGGAVLALADHNIDALHRPLLALTIVVVSLVAPLAADGPSKAAVLALIVMPGLFAGLVLRTVDYALTMVLLPFMVLAALTVGPGRVDPAIGWAWLLVLAAALALAHGLRRQHESARAELAFANAQDPLTGLLTRAGLRDHADQFPRGTDAVVVFVDVDGVDEVRRTHGAEMREQTLQMIARVLSSLAGRTGAAARVGADQFVILLPESVRLTTVRRTIDHALALFDPPVAASVGHAFGKVGRDVDVWRLVEAADEARRGARRAADDTDDETAQDLPEASAADLGQMIPLAEHADALRR